MTVLLSFLRRALGRKEGGLPRQYGKLEGYMGVQLFSSVSWGVSVTCGATHELVPCFTRSRVAVWTL